VGGRSDRDGSPVRFVSLKGNVSLEMQLEQYKLMVSSQSTADSKTTFCQLTGIELLTTVPNYGCR